MNIKCVRIELDIPTGMYVYAFIQDPNDKPGSAISGEIRYIADDPKLWLVGDVFPLAKLPG